MTRVIPVHHFDNQQIQTCEEPLAVTTAPPDRLLIALPHHVIEVRNLTSPQRDQFTFPTVDRVCDIIYCATGNYVATLEKKQTRQNTNVTYARVYTNWEKKTPDEEQGMRARIAGRVTPSSSQTGGDVLEMIELPVRFQVTTAFTCCQETGNVLVACDRVLCLFQLVRRTHDISRLKFLDFELWPVTLELSFAPSSLSMSEDVVAAGDSASLHVFRVNKGFARPTDWSSSPANSSPRNVPKAKHQESKKPSNDRPSSPVRLDQLISETTENRSPYEALKLSNGPSLPVIAVLPSVKNRISNNLSWARKPSPFKPPGSVVMGVAIKEIPANEPWAEQMTTMVESLLQLELCDAENGVKDEFTCLALRPQYKITSYPTKAESSCPRMRSPAYVNLVSFNCLICTQQEGFMFHFPVFEGEVMSLGKCITEYYFTSAVKHIILEPYLLHAWTMAGLETYTLRTIHAIEENYTEKAFPPLSEPVCLVGLRPFMNVTSLQLTKSNIVILSSASESNTKGDSEATIYCLKLPSAGTLYTDMLSVGMSHRFTNTPSNTLYFQLLNEAHAVLRCATSLSTDPNYRPLPVENELYRESCALLAEYHLSRSDESDWNIGYKYSLEAQLTPTQVMDRLRKLETEAADFELNVNPGLIHYLKTCLMSCDEDSKIPVSALAAFLDMIDTIPTHSPFILSTLILGSSVLRQFSTERTTRMISNRIAQSGNVDSIDCVALAVLYISKGKFKDAAEVIKLTKETALVQVLLNYWKILFDDTRKKTKVTPIDWEGVTLSELSVLLVEKKPKELSTALCSLLENECVLKLQNILQVFLTYLPTRGQGGAQFGSFLQMFLEGVFNNLVTSDPNWAPNSDPSFAEALKILMRSLLSGLVVKAEPKTDNDLNEAKQMFGGKRPTFLDHLPPTLTPNSKHVNLLKLQCLLSSSWLNDSALSELVQFVSEFVEEDIGFSLLVLAQPQKAVELVIEKHPRVLSQFVKDMLRTETELKHLVLTLQSKADDEADDTKAYSQLLDEILDDLAKTLNCDVFTKIVPPGKEFECYILKCQQTAHASHLKEMIMVTGHRLMATMNLKSFT